MGDAAIRSALRIRFREEHGRDPETVVIEELGLCRGRVRLDVAVVNGLLHGYEIKSDRDSLRRLDNQVDVYGKVLDRATLVVGDRFLTAACGLLPPWWGVLHARVDGAELRFRTVRSPAKNPGRDPRALVELLWSDQAIGLLDRHGAARGVRRKPRRIVWERVCERFEVDEIADAVRVGLKSRTRNPDPARPG